MLANAKIGGQQGMGKRLMDVAHDSVCHIGVKQKENAKKKTNGTECIGNGVVKR